MNSQSDGSIVPNWLGFICRGSTWRFMRQLAVPIFLVSLINFCLATFCWAAPELSEEEAIHRVLDMFHQAIEAPGHHHNHGEHDVDQHEWDRFEKLENREALTSDHHDHNHDHVHDHDHDRPHSQGDRDIEVENLKRILRTKFDLEYQPKMHEYYQFLNGINDSHYESHHQQHHNHHHGQRHSWGKRLSGFFVAFIQPQTYRDWRNRFNLVELGINVFRAYKVETRYQQVKNHAANMVLLWPISETTEIFAGPLYSAFNDMPTFVDATVGTFLYLMGLPGVDPLCAIIIFSYPFAIVNKPVSLIRAPVFLTLRFITLPLLSIKKLLQRKKYIHTIDSLLAEINQLQKADDWTIKSEKIGPRKYEYFFYHQDHKKYQLSLRLLMNEDPKEGGPRSSYIDRIVLNRHDFAYDPDMEKSFLNLIKILPFNLRHYLKSVLKHRRHHTDDQLKFVKNISVSNEYYTYNMLPRALHVPNQKYIRKLNQCRYLFYR